MSGRPLINLDIHKLEKQFVDKKTNEIFLNMLVHELQFRKTKRALDLKNLAEAALKKAIIRPGQSIKKHLEETNRNKPYSPNLVEKISKGPIAGMLNAAPAKKMPVLTRAEIDLTGLTEPERILLTWTALEVLSPQSFLRPEDLASGDYYRILQLENGLPWEKGGEKSRPNYRLYYQIVLGTVSMVPAIAQLLTVYTDERAERPAARGESVLATITVDREGRPVESDAVALSSFSWGLPIALSGNLKALGEWQVAEAELLKELDKQIRHVDEGDEKPQPLTLEAIYHAYTWLAEKLGIGPELLSPPVFAVRSYQYFKYEDPPEALLLNSFFLGDLDKARTLFETNTATTNLKRYIGQIKPPYRKDLLRDTEAIQDALSPAKMPQGRWPAKGRHPLVSLQQAAVNLAAHDLRDNGIIAVNGPPGTGKTTLLRDIVAHIVSERASVMATFDDPEDAFSNSNLRVKKGNAFLWMYKLDERLRGFEIIVASSNNKAVENVSTELPARGAVADDAFKKGYFKTTADSLLERDTWGLIAAVLGNGANRAKFRQKFWWDDDTGMSRYLQFAAGTPTMITGTDEHGKKFERPPIIIKNEKPPSDKMEALHRWKKARQEYQETQRKAKKILDDAELAARLPEKLLKMHSDLEESKNALDALAQNENAVRENITEAEKQHASLAGYYSQCLDMAQEIKGRKPGWLTCLLRLQDFRIWAQEYRLASEKADNANQSKITAEKRLLTSQHELQRIQQSAINLNTNAAILKVDLERCKSELLRVQSILGGVQIDESYFALSHKDRQLASPWLGSAASKVRDELFEAAIRLHRAFIDAAARPLRHNLGLLMDSFGTRSFGTAEKDAITPHLWSSLFLIVPVVSTTFASVNRMFNRISPDEFGWLLVDEAGQALPQAAVGALMRCKRAVVVGDPLQVEPVVVLPEKLTEALCKEFKIDASHFNAPAASTQTLADSATSYFSTFETKMGSRDIGVPLLVHRRCADPMFSISNAIAYENLMVQEKSPKLSAIADVLGPATWHHVSGEGQDKWCESEGEYVLNMLKKLKLSGVQPNLYIVTPFVVVQDRLREHVRRSGLLDNWVENSSRWPYERIGTVHTVQGREAEAVILVLGAPLAHQTGARGWAGGRPNILNVAVSRAQEVLYVVGNRDLWSKVGVFSELDDRL
jgi:hypothetical protein